MKYFSIIFFLLFGTSAIAQENLHLLQHNLKNAKDNKSKISALLDITKFYIDNIYYEEYPFATDSATYYIAKAEHLSQETNNERGLAKSYNLHAALLDTETKIDNNEQRYKQSLEYISKAVSILSKLQDQPLLGEIYYTKYIIQQNTIPRKQTIKLAEEAKSLVSKGDNKFLQACITEDLAYYYGHDNNIALAKANAYEAIKLFKSCDPKSVYKMYSYLGAIYNELGDYNKALNYCLKGIEYAERYKDEVNYQTVDLYNYTAVTYRSLEKYDKALEYFKKAVAIAEKLGNDASLVFYEANAAETALLSGNKSETKYYLKKLEDKSYLADNPNYVNGLGVLVQSYIKLNDTQKADKYAALILEKYNAFDGTPDGDWAKNKFSGAMLSYYFYKKDYDSSRKHTLIYKEKAEKTGSKPKIMHAYDMLFRLDSAQGYYKSAISNLKMEQLYRDSIFNEAKNRQLTEMQVKYETQQRIKDNQLLKKQTELQKSKIERASILNLVGIGAIIILAVSVALIYRRYLINHKTKKAINAKNIALENLVNEKEWLLKEIHHRVKNNLQIVMSLLGVQSHFLNDNGAKEAIKNSQHRIHSMSLIHKKLYQSDNINSVNIELYFKELIEYYKVAFDTKERIRFELDIDPINIESSQAVPMGLILNEAVNNALKHAFQDNSIGMIKINVKVNNNDIYFSIEDNGTGMPTIGDSDYKSLGLNLIIGFSRELNAELEITGDNGVTIATRFKINHTSVA